MSTLRLWDTVAWNGANDKGYKAFMMHIHICMTERGVEEESIRLERDLAFEKWGGVVRAGRFESVRAAVADFNDWFVGYEVLGVGSTVINGSVTVTISAPVKGGGMVSFAITDELSKECDSLVVEAKATVLARMLRKVYTGYQARRASELQDEIPATENQQSALPLSPADSQGVRTTDTGVLVLEVKDNKRYYKFKFGEWQQFGVVIWDEVFVAAGIDPKKVKNGDKWKGTFIVKMKNDKPVKVVQLIDGTFSRQSAILQDPGDDGAEE